MSFNPKMSEEEALGWACKEFWRQERNAKKIAKILEKNIEKTNRKEYKEKVIKNFKKVDDTND